MVLRLFLVVLAGTAGHRAYEPTRQFGPRWGSLLRYAIGIILFIPCQIIIKLSIPERAERFGEVERDIVSGLLTAGALGTGTLIGHFMDGENETP
jgi:hypothetical protein